MLQIKQTWLFVLSASAAIGCVLAFDNKIVNGSIALPGEFPYMVSLRRSSSGRHSCGASLLNRVWVLTAAHCVVKVQPHQVNIQFGSNELDRNSTNVANIAKIFVHEGYNPSNQYIHDIALLRLDKAAKVDSDFIGIRLPEYNSATASETPALLIGWGLNAVSVRLATGKRHFCAGTILNSQWILTAAHCFTYIKSPKDIVIQYGTHELQPHQPQYEEVEEIIKHPGYNPTVTIHDIALIKLRNPLNLNKNIQKVDLIQNVNINLDHVQVQLLGWGLNETYGSLNSNLHQVSLTTLTLAECRSQLKSVIHKTNLCAGELHKGQCSGDSGGPLMLRNKQLALVSWSLKPCGRQPGVFTNVVYYIDWIRLYIE